MRCVRNGSNTPAIVAAAFVAASAVAPAVSVAAAAAVLPRAGTVYLAAVVQTSPRGTASVNPMSFHISSTGERIVRILGGYYQGDMCGGSQFYFGPDGFEAPPPVAIKRDGTFAYQHTSSDGTVMKFSGHFSPTNARTGSATYLWHYPGTAGGASACSIKLGMTFREAPRLPGGTAGPPSRTTYRGVDGEGWHVVANLNSAGTRVTRISVGGYGLCRTSPTHQLLDPEAGYLTNIPIRSGAFSGRFTYTLPHSTTKETLSISGRFVVRGRQLVGSLSFARPSGISCSTGSIAYGGG